jgi:hypothetical protein
MSEGCSSTLVLKMIEKLSKVKITKKTENFIINNMRNSGSITITLFKGFSNKIKK